MTATASPSPASSTVQRPTSVDEAAKVLRDSRGSVLFRGAGTKMSWAGRPEDPDLVLETGGLDRLLDHNPADMTASAQAGMPLRALQDRLAEAGQWLALDPPTEPDGATLGGLLATGESGPRRLRYGALRDLVIGVTLVLPDGTVARAGGHVIKNVAGYDLSKLMYGSLGTLGLIAEVVLRLHPLTGDERHRRGAVVGPGGDRAQRRPARLAAGTLGRRLGRRPRGGGSSGPAGRAVRGHRRRRGGADGGAAGAPGRGRAGGVGRYAMRPRCGGSTPAPTGPSRARALAFAGTLPSRLTAVAAALRRRGRRRRGGRLAGLPQRTRAAHRSVLRTAGATGGGVRPVAPRGRWRSAAPCCCGSAPPRSTPTSTRSVPHPRPSVSCVPSRPGWIPTAAAPWPPRSVGCDRPQPHGVRR